MTKGHTESMKNNRFLFSAIGLSIANIMLVAVGVILMPSIAWAVTWAVSALVMHVVLLAVVGYYELQATLAADAIALKKMIARSKELR